MNSHFLFHAPRIRNGGFSRSTASLSAAVLTLALAASTLAPGTPEITPSAHAATPVIPDDLPIFPKITENPQISVTFEDGTPVEGATVHHGDVLLVHGIGFSPKANQGGFPLPVPPGVPNGLYALSEPSPHTGNPARAQIHLPAPTHTIAWRGSCQKAPWTVFLPEPLTCAVPSQGRSSE